MDRWMKGKWKVGRSNGKWRYGIKGMGMGERKEGVEREGSGEGR